MPKPGPHPTELIAIGPLSTNVDAIKVAEIFDRLNMLFDVFIINRNIPYLYQRSSLKELKTSHLGSNEYVMVRCNPASLMLADLPKMEQVRLIFKIMKTQLVGSNYEIHPSTN